MQAHLKASSKFISSAVFKAQMLMGKCVHLIIQSFQKYMKNKSRKGFYIKLYVCSLYQGEVRPIFGVNTDFIFRAAVCLRGCLYDKSQTKLTLNIYL